MIYSSEEIVPDSSNSRFLIGLFLRESCTTIFTEVEIYRHLFLFLSKQVPFFSESMLVSANIRLRANGRNIVDQQLPTLLDVICCVRLHTLFCMLLRKV